MKSSLNNLSNSRFFRGKRRVLAAAVAAIALSGGAATILGVQHARGQTKKAPAPAPSITVDVVAPAPSVFGRVVAATGTVAPRDELIIGSDAAGVRLVEVLVETGSVVRKGQLLARGDDAQLLAQLAQQEALIKQAQADTAQADENLERAEKLDGSGVYSAETLQTRHNTAAAARAKLDLVRAQRRELEVRIGYTRVLAPAAGIISKKSATVGAVVQPGVELFRMMRDGELEWRAELPSHSLAKVHAGARVEVMLEEGRAIEAKVRLVAPTIDTSTRNGLVYVALPASAPFKSGALAKGQILVDATGGLAVPESSVLTRDGYAFVYVVDSGETAHIRKVETGARQNGMVEIRAGLTPQARIVGMGAGFVKDGDRVRVAPESLRRIAQFGG
jgi:HlyD family secretion protein